MNKKRTKVRPQPGKLTALERCLEQKPLHAAEWCSLLLAQIVVAKAASDQPSPARLNDMRCDSLEHFG